jgi:predicted  nucleic acid-binding Zn-ribbon protein
VSATDGAPTTPLEVTQYIGQILRRKRALLDETHTAELRARELRRAADRAEARAYISAEGPAHAKKYMATLDKTFQAAEAEADVAESALKYLRDRIRHCGDELEGARTAAATLRAEFGVMGLHGNDGA